MLVFELVILILVEVEGGVLLYPFRSKLRDEVSNARSSSIGLDDITAS